MYEGILATMRDELSMGTRVELRPLMDVPGMSAWAARALYAAGMWTPLMVVGRQQVPPPPLPSRSTHYVPKD
jgi:hypothetical protein